MKKKTVENQIVMYFHCGECLKEKPPGESPKTYQRIQAGWTKKGFQIWCVRHEMNVIHIDFCGQKVEVAA